MKFFYSKLFNFIFFLFYVSKANDLKDFCDRFNSSYCEISKNKEYSKSLDLTISTLNISNCSIKFNESPLYEVNIITNVTIIVNSTIDSININFQAKEVLF